jgi:hypothetical protein
MEVKRSVDFFLGVIDICFSVTGNRTVVSMIQVEFIANLKSYQVS